MEKEKQLKADAVICQFGEYPARKQKWLQDHIGAEIVEEIKTLFTQPSRVPSGVILQNQDGNATMLCIIWAITYKI